MRTETVNVYNYEDMSNLTYMTPDVASEILKDSYRGYINRYLFPVEGKEYTESQYYEYMIQCAFNVAYRALIDSKEKAK